jgi:hypothetical protein
MASKPNYTHYNTTFQPIALPDDASEDFVGVTALASGYGLTADGKLD